MSINASDLVKFVGLLSSHVSYQYFAEISIIEKIEVLLKSLFEFCGGVELQQNDRIPHLNFLEPLEDIFSLFLFIVNPNQQIASIDFIFIANFLHLYLKDACFFCFFVHFEVSIRSKNYLSQLKLRRYGSPRF